MEPRRGKKETHRRKQTAVAAAGRREQGWPGDEDKQTSPEAPVQGGGETQGGPPGGLGCRHPGRRAPRGVQGIGAALPALALRLGRRRPGCGLVTSAAAQLVHWKGRGAGGAEVLESQRTDGAEGLVGQGDSWGDDLVGWEARGPVRQGRRWSR